MVKNNKLVIIGLIFLVIFMINSGKKETSTVTVTLDQEYTTMPYTFGSMQYIYNDCLITGNDLQCTIGIKNNGGTVAGPILMELTPDTEKKSSTVVRQSATCDAAQPQNRHTLINNIAAGETAYFTIKVPTSSMISAMGEGTFYFRVITYDKCCSGNPSPPCVAVSPFGDQNNYVAKVTYSTEQQCDCTEWDDAPNCAPDNYDCPEGQRLITRTCPNNCDIEQRCRVDNSCIPNSCNLPWGGVIASGVWVTAYQSPSAATCVSEKRTCTNGELSGSYEYQSCTATNTCSNLGGVCKSNQCSSYDSCSALTTGTCSVGNCCTGTCGSMTYDCKGNLNVPALNNEYTCKDGKYYKCETNAWQPTNGMSCPSGICNPNNVGKATTSSSEACCTADCSCASSTCAGSTCSNGCGGTCTGTKTCPGTCDNDGTCDSGETTANCPNDCKVTPDACNNECMGFIQTCNTKTGKCDVSVWIWYVVGFMAVMMFMKIVMKGGDK